MKILFKYPSRDRPDWFMETLQRYYAMLSEENQCHFLITLNEDDKTMNNSKMRLFMDGFPNLVYKYGNHKTKIEAVNADMEGEEFDILFLVSDDMIPQTSGFDLIISEDMKEHFPDLDGALHYDVGGPNADEKGYSRCIYLSIMGKKLYDWFGYIYNPIYKSFGCDNEFRDVVYKIKKVVHIPRRIVEHEWKGAGKNRDILYARNLKMAKGDIPLYAKRKRKIRMVKNVKDIL